MPTSTQRRTSSRRKSSSAGSTLRMDPPHGVSDTTAPDWLAQELSPFAPWIGSDLLAMYLEDRCSQADRGNIMQTVMAIRNNFQDRPVPFRLIEAIAGPAWTTRDILLARALLPNSGAMLAWRQFIDGATGDDDIRRRCVLVWNNLINEPQGFASTEIGDVFWNLYDGINPAVEFGERTGKPELIDGTLFAAIRKLFRIRKPSASQRDAAPAPRAPAPPAAGSAVSGVTLPIASIDVVHNARTEFDAAELKKLAKSIETFGILQPLLVKATGDGRFALVAGERRLRAAGLAKLTEVPVTIATGDDETTSLMALEENIKRVDLSPIDRARELQRLRDDHGMTQAQIAAFVGVTQGQISNELRLLNLPESLQQKIASGDLAPTMARILLPFCDVPEVMADMEDLDVRLDPEAPLTEEDLKSLLRESIISHSRSMKFDEHWSSWSRPERKKRHFKSLADTDRKELAPRTIEWLQEYHGKERTFNIEKFDELNKAPLARRLKAHKAYKAKQSSLSGSSKETSAEPPVKAHLEWAIENTVEKQLSDELRSLVINTKRAGTVNRVVLAMFITEMLGEWAVGEVLEAVPQRGDMLKALREWAFRQIELAEQSDSGWWRRGTIEEIVQLGEALGADVRATWLPEVETLSHFTTHGLQIVREHICPEATETGNALIERLIEAWPRGYVPPFLRTMFAYPPEKQATRKKKGAKS